MTLLILLRPTPSPKALSMQRHHRWRPPSPDAAAVRTSHKSGIDEAILRGNEGVRSCYKSTKQRSRSGLAGFAREFDTHYVDLVLRSPTAPSTRSVVETLDPAAVPRGVVGFEVILGAYVLASMARLFPVSPMALSVA